MLLQRIAEARTAGLSAETSEARILPMLDLSRLEDRSRRVSAPDYTVPTILMTADDAWLALEESTKSVREALRLGDALRPRCTELAASAAWTTIVLPVVRIHRCTRGPTCGANSRTRCCDTERPRIPILAGAAVPNSTHSTVTCDRPPFISLQLNWQQ